jgi:hypothetical protein
MCLSALPPVCLVTNAHSPINAIRAIADEWMDPKRAFTAARAHAFSAGPCDSHCARVYESCFLTAAKKFCAVKNSDICLSLGVWLIISAALFLGTVGVKKRAWQITQQQLLLLGKGRIIFLVCLRCASEQRRACTVFMGGLLFLLRKVKDSLILI